MLQQDKPEDFILATGETHAVRESVEEYAQVLDFDPVWNGRESKRSEWIKSGKTIIRIDPFFFRPTEVDLLIGDASKARKILGWKPKTTFSNLVNLMTEYDYKLESKTAE